jgi:hypothetical protein
MKHIKNFFLRLFSEKQRAGVFCLSLTLLSACNNGQESQPDVSGIKVSINSRRLDLDLRNIDTTHIAAGLQQIAPKYTDFIDFYLDTLMGFGINQHYNDTVIGIRRNLHTFLTHKDFRGVFDTTAKHFPDVKSQDIALEKGFKYMKHYFPEYKIPKIIYFVTGLRNWSAITYGDDIIGVGLDMALGADYPNYSRVEIPDYVSRNLVPESIPVNVFKSVYNLQQPFITENKTLLDMMIQKGKEQYFLSKIIPFVPDALRLGFTTAQLDWCKENEAGIYNFLVKGQLLYDTNWQKILRYVTDGPSSAGMSPESPGNVGTWLGWKIIQSYMNQHPETTMEQLLILEDAQKLLQDAHYKPR